MIVSGNHISKLVKGRSTNRWLDVNFKILRHTDDTLMSMGMDMNIYPT